MTTPLCPFPPPGHEAAIAAAVQPAPAPGLNPLSAPFVPSAPASVDGTISTPDFSEWSSEPESEPEPEPEPAAVNSALLTDVPPPRDPYQSMIYNNLAEALWSMACVPARWVAPRTGAKGANLVARIRLYMYMFLFSFVSCCDLAFVLAHMI